ncbi:sensor domain-containing diguanylate cyclase [Vallitalea pronyensis]|uniref:Sensor domain-containing diguanylate cyclase n=1 Tax=Vallitalea pronyensis TaxID=1348613 RepID=A0A8J8ML13_9FIRM|nr:sensor domain-containing diguanylate cyclase [Vallitalea pronyensis]QUI23449.1 sensor domain-containing diguanylate cyclase [Vallitalea pronyensis]
MERTLKYDKNFIGIHSIMIIIISVYAIVARFYDKLNPSILLGLFIIIAFYVVNVLLYRIKYFNNIYVFYVIKLIQMLIVAVIMFEENRFLSNSAGILYVLTSLEVIIIFIHGGKRSRYNINWMLILPLVIASLYAFTFRVFDHEPLFLMIQCIIIIMGVYAIFFGSTEELKQQVYEQKNLWVQLKKKNVELKISSDQVLEVHHELLNQKAALEEANERLNRFTAEMYIQNELLSYISRALDIEELMKLVIDSIIGAIGVDTCSLVIYDANFDTYMCKVKSTHRQDYSKAFVEAVKSSKLEKYFSLGTPYIDNHVRKGAYDFMSGRDAGSLVIIPIMKEKSTYGLLIAEHESSRMFSENSIQFFGGIANQINIAITNANLYSKMEEMAKRDGLTGVHNRTYLQEVLDDLSKKAKQGLMNLSVALFDIDKFKNINDTYGHLFGDEVLKIIATITENYAKSKGGIVGRYGGEEFLLIFSDKTLEETREIMESIHKMIHEQTLYYNDKSISVNISTGISSYPEVCDDPEDLLHRADHAMYFSKTNGRGRITIDNIQL